MGNTDPAAQNGNHGPLFQGLGVSVDHVINKGEFGGDPQIREANETSVRKSMQVDEFTEVFVESDKDTVFGPSSFQKG